MKTFVNYTNVVAIKEMSGGNESVGDMWVETKTFPKETPVEEIIHWAKNCGGRLTICIDENGADDKVFNDDLPF